LNKLGLYIEQSDARNSEYLYKEDAVVGLSTQKQIIKTKADLTGVSLTSYKLVPPDAFAYVPDTSRRGDKVSLAHNDSDETYLVSSISIVFFVKKDCGLLSDYLFMYFNRPEFDRYARFNSWGSARETFSWEDMCDIDIELPSLEIQQKYVNVYKAMVANQKSYEKGLDDLKLVCDAYIEDLRRKYPNEKINSFITEVSNKNEQSLYGVNNIKGISINKEFVPTKANTDGIAVNGYKIVLHNQFAFNPNTARMGEKICVALNTSDDVYLVSSIYPVFEIIDMNLIVPEYLMMWLKRSEFDRYVRFNSWGSAREVFNFTDMAEIRIPIPDKNTQDAIVAIYKAYLKRIEINEKLKAQIKDICPVLIQGALNEGRKKVI
jgi:type I restriction enzyme S subunit